VRAVPVLSAGVVALAGLALAVEAVGQLDEVAGVHLVFDTPAAYSGPLTALSAVLAIAAAAFWLRSRRPPRWPALVPAGHGPATADGHGYRAGNDHGHDHGHADLEATARPAA
jgi:hypothetical protein